MNTSSVNFVVETLVVRNGRKLSGLRPDADGYFKSVPIAVLGIPTRNNTYYDIDSIVKEMTSGTSAINMTLSDGNLYGEWGHPYLDPTKPDLQRLLTIKEDRQSHHFRKIYTGEQLDNGGVVVYGDIKPTGPYGKILYDQLIDPYMNSSFSLRSICSERRDSKRNLVLRTVKKLVTFDAVGAGGYAEASKRYVGANESLKLEYEDFINADTGEYACESITDRDILDIFGATDIVINRQTLGKVIPGNKSYIDHDGHKRSVVHSFIKR
jgi:hypothetical protein